LQTFCATATTYARVDVEQLRCRGLGASNECLDAAGRGILAYRRYYGFELTIDATQLRSFARFAEKIDTSGHLTTELAVAWAWARASQLTTPRTWARRIEIFRGFARFCLRGDPTTEIPPRGLFGPATCRCVFGLLAATGLRISEALTLSKVDVDLHSGILHIREAKFHQQRFVLLHPSVTDSLLSYAQRRDQLVPRPSCDRFFLRDDGNGANQPGILYALQMVCEQLGWQPRGDYRRHCLHDMRHTFIVRSMLRSYKRGVVIDKAVLALSIYVGHAKESDTYWYVSGILELMAIAAECFHLYSQGEA
jgi:integrase/recombinase XerD